MKKALGLLRDNAALIIGLALFCGMLRPPYFGSLVTKNMVSAHELRLLYDFSLILFGGILLCFSATASAGMRSRRQHDSSILTGAVSVIGIAIVNASHLLAPSSTVLPALGVVITAAGFVFLGAGWMKQLSLAKRDDVLPVLMLAFLLNHATGLLDLLSREAEAWAIAILPMLSAICLFRCAKNVTPAQSSSPNLLPRLDQMRILALIIVCVEILCTSFLRANYTNGGTGYAPATGTLTTYVVSAAVAVVGYALVSRRKATAENALVTSGVALGLLVVSAFLTASPLHGPVHHLVTGLHSMLIILLFGLIALWQHDGDKNYLTCAGVFAMLFGVAVDLTFSMAPGILGLEAGAITHEQRLFTTLIATLLICLGCGVGLYSVIKIQRRELSEAREALVTQAAVFAAELAAECATNATEKGIETSEETGAPLAEEATGSTPSATVSHPTAVLKPPFSAPAQPATAVNNATALAKERNAIAWLAERYSLTPRETETAALIAKGYTVKRIAEELNVTPATIQSHSKSIYRKLDIHRKDELIAMAEQHQSE